MTRYYQVTLKSGIAAVFEDVRNYNNFPEILVASGVYSITPPNTPKEPTPVNKDTVRTIMEIDKETAKSINPSIR